MKICKECNREFNPTSRHLKCPICREKTKRRKCLDCDNFVWHQNKRCKECSIKSKTGIKIPVDKFTGFREFLRRARNRGKLGDLELQDLLDTWNNQNGQCPYSGISLELPSYKKKNNQVNVASLDRIDSSLPYTKGNIQFVSASINYMKNELTHEETVQLCKQIAKFWS